MSYSIHELMDDHSVEIWNQRRALDHSFITLLYLDSAQCTSLFTDEVVRSQLLALG